MAKVHNVTGLKCSETLKIKAAVVEIMENSGFTVTDNGDMIPSTTEGCYVMSFQRGVASLDELINVSDTLGDKFHVSVEPKDKNSIKVSVEATLDSFKQLLA